MLIVRQHSVILLMQAFSEARLHRNKTSANIRDLAADSLLPGTHVDSFIAEAEAALEEGSRLPPVIMPARHSERADCDSSARPCRRRRSQTAWWRRRSCARGWARWSEARRSWRLRAACRWAAACHSAIAGVLGL